MLGPQVPGFMREAMNTTRKVVFISGLLLTVLLVAACAGAGDNEGSASSDAEGSGPTSDGKAAAAATIPVYQLAQEVPMTIEVTTSALKETGFLLADFTCEGANSSPHISWGDVPAGTQSIAVVAEDLGFLGGIASHWLLWGVPPDTREVAAGVSGSTDLPAGAVEGMNSGGNSGYRGPCPSPKIIYQGPICKATGFDSNPYVWNVYAIDKPVALEASATRDELLKAIDGSILAGGSIDVKYISKTLLRNIRGINCWG